ncbi:MAG TPA: ABC transporter ATP-binding protein [Devosiaceae bacterium]|nr:ABC transporter ATP-binding protein [Devosiaceae bacterium]
MTLEVKGLNLRIGRTPILEDLSFRIAGGEAAAVLGRNGAGKTTLVRGLAGLLPARGEVRLEGETIDRLPAAQRASRIGYVAQSFVREAAELSAHELMLLSLNGGRGGWQVPSTNLARVEEVIELLRLGPLANRAANTMSGGQRQMLALALAIVRRPRLLLLDEPTSALDLANQLHLLEVVRDYTRREGIATLMVLHDLNLAARYAEQVLMLADGRIAFDGPPAAALTPPRLAQIYGVECAVTFAEGGHTAITPLRAL